MIFVCSHLQIKLSLAWQSYDDVTVSMSGAIDEGDGYSLFTATVRHWISNLFTCQVLISQYLEVVLQLNAGKNWPK